ncbi:MAG: hypothetical protein HQL76_17430 [Magnetococcales bacterium]|nr:hypothetical protein [Magnetococcales bacterium]
MKQVNTVSERQTHFHRETLSDQYGNLHLPSRLKEWELDENGLCKSFNDDERIIFDNVNAQEWIDPGTTLFRWLANPVSGTTFIWLIDGHGRLIIGKERPVTPDNPDNMLGHPALVAGGRARIAGELKWHEENQYFMVNNRSGRYTKKSADSEKKEHLERVVSILNRIADVCEQTITHRFVIEYDPDYGANLVNSVFDLRNEVLAYLSLPNLSLRKSGEELGRKLAISTSMKNKLEEVPRLANEWSPPDIRVTIISAHTLISWLDRVPEHDPNLADQLSSSLAKWYNLDSEELHNAILEIYVIFLSKWPVRNTMMRETVEHFATKHAFSTDTQNPTLKRIREFLASN